MKKILILFFVFATIVLNAQQSKNVFFIGNSYTATGNIPQLIKQIAASSGDDLTYTAHTPGGTTFQQHVSNATVISNLAQSNWDIVVLQEQSQLPSFPQGQVEQEVFPFAAQLSNMARENNPCVEVAFYMTWGRKNGDNQNCQYWPPVCTYEGMDDLLYERYMTMAEENEAMVSPVGRVWRYIRTHYPDVELYSGDGSHPSAVGSMTAAYTFYTSIFNKSPFDANFNGSISQENIDIIKEAVYETVFTNMDAWNFMQNEPVAAFEYDIDQLQVSFFNTSVNSDTYLWDFGDGNISTEENPIHVFTQAGTYLVKLTTQKCGDVDETETLINVASVGLEDLDFNTFKIWPNPVKEMLNLDAQETIEKIWILDLTGKVVMTYLGGKATAIPVNHLASGVYFALVKTQDNVVRKKFVKE